MTEKFVAHRIVTINMINRQNPGVSVIPGPFSNGDTSLITASSAVLVVLPGFVVVDCLDLASEELEEEDSNALLKG